MALTITDSNFEEVVMKSDKPVLIDFWAEWCGPCRMVGPIVEELAKEYDGKAVIGKLDVDNNPNVPCSLVFAIFPPCYFSRTDRSWTNRSVLFRKAFSPINSTRNSFKKSSKFRIPSSRLIPELGTTNL